MTETLTMQDFKTGTESGAFRPESSPQESYSAIEIARLCGYSSDRWTRDRRQELEEIFVTCANGKRLIENLKTSSGRYSSFALQQIQELQKATSTAIPVLKDGFPVMAKGKAKLQQVERKMTLSQYAETLREKYGKAQLEEASDPEQDPEFPPGIEAEIVEEDPELVSTKLVFQPQDRTAEIAAIQDDTASIAGDAYAGLSSFEKNLVSGMADRGFMIGSLAMQQYTAGIQKAMNQGASDIHSESSDKPEAKTSRKSTRKKS